MNSNLVPEQRVDKNGRTTTRWVKPSSASSQKRSIPTPALSREDLLDEAQEHRQMLLGALHKSCSFVSMTLEAAINRAPLQELKLLVELLNMDRQVAVEALVSARSSTSARDAVNIAAVYDPELMPKVTSPESRVFMLNKILDLAHSKVFGEDANVSSEHWGNYYYDDANRASLKRFVNWVADATTQTRTSMTIDDDIIDLMLDPKWEQAEEAVGYLKRNPSITRTQLDHLLSGNNPSLSSGAL